MPRNLIRRVEIFFPVSDDRLVRRLKDNVLATYMADNVKARHMNSDGTYVRVTPGPNERPMNAQEAFMAYYNSVPTS